MPCLPPFMSKKEADGLMYCKILFKCIFLCMTKQHWNNKKKPNEKRRKRKEVADLQVSWRGGGASFYKCKFARRKECLRNRTLLMGLQVSSAFLTVCPDRLSCCNLVFLYKKWIVIEAKALPLHCGWRTPHNVYRTRCFFVFLLLARCGINLLA